MCCSAPAGACNCPALVSSRIALLRSPSHAPYSAAMENATVTKSTSNNCHATTEGTRHRYAAMSDLTVRLERYAFRRACQGGQRPLPLPAHGGWRVTGTSMPQRTHASKARNYIGYLSIASLACTSLAAVTFSRGRACMWKCFTHRCKRCLSLLRASGNVDVALQ